MKAQSAMVTSGRNGVIKVVTDDERDYYTVEEVMKLLGIKRSKAYGLMRGLRKEMMGLNLLFPEYPAGRVPKYYFNDRCGIGERTGGR